MKQKQPIDLDIEIARSKRVLKKYSHDTSIFEIEPKAVIYPKNAEDVKRLVKYVSSHKKKTPNLSITPRSGGTDMTGGSINDSLIVVTERYMNRIGRVRSNRIVTQPGVYFRDFDKVTKVAGKEMPSYPASREIAAIGGMAANNAGGEKSLIYGKTQDYVKRLKVVLSDGNEYEFRKLKKKQLKQKLKLKNFEGEVYRRMFKLVSHNYDLLQKAKPKVSKNSTGYRLWDVYDKENETFDLTQLFVGSQGTLGFITEIEFELVDYKQHSGLLIGFIPRLDHLPDVVNTVVKHGPSSFETFDDHTLKFAMKFFFQFRKTLGWGKFIKLAFSFLPDLFLMLRGLPKLIMLAEYESDDPDEIKENLDKLKDDLKKRHPHILFEEAETESKSERFWLMRRESFNLLRKNVKGRHTAPFIDDLVIPPENLPKFFPEFKKILEKYELLYTIAGHLGDGNFHVIPLMDLSNPKERAKLEPCLKETIALVKKYGGSMSGEHNDGMIRGPFLEKMYGRKVYEHFADTKKIFDPLNIFNPHKKVDATWGYSQDHIRTSF